MDLGRPGAPSAGLLRIEDGDGGLIREFKVEEPFVPALVDLGSDTHGTEIRFRAETFSPGTDDRRELGVAVSRMRMAGVLHGLKRCAPALLPRRALPLAADRSAATSASSTSYNTILANSEYTRGFIEDWWERQADILYPPIATAKLRPAARA